MANNDNNALPFIEPIDWAFVEYEVKIGCDDAGAARGSIEYASHADDHVLRPSGWNDSSDRLLFTCSGDSVQDVVTKLAEAFLNVHDSDDADNNDPDNEEND